MPKRLSIAMPSNQWSSRFPPTSRRAGVTRTSAPLSQRGARRRRLDWITDKGRQALEEWRSEPTDAIFELRAPALLKLFFGAAPVELARVQVEAHRRKLAEYEQIRDTMPGDVPAGPRL